MRRVSSRLRIAVTTSVNSWGVMVFDKSGKQIDHIPVQENWTANVSFGGKDRQTLFITASKGFYSIKLRVKGGYPAK